MVEDLPLLRTKLYIPPVRAELVPRQRLIERINAGLDRRLTLVSAPAGFGKTTLLGEWTDCCGPRARVGWLSLDEGDNDPHRFWTYLFAALQTVDSGLGEAARDRLGSGQMPPVELFLTDLINDIAEIPDRFALVLDDFHLIVESQVQDGLLFLLDNLPPPPGGMHLMVAGRADPPWSLARLRARRDLTELRVDDLRFTPEEAAVFLNHSMQLALSAGDVAALEARTEGWIAGLQMAAISMRGRQRTQDAGDLSRFIETLSGSHRFILDYLVEEVLDQQAPDVQDFLLKTSILERMTPRLCVAVTDRADSQAILDQLERANLFLLPLDEGRVWYRYHRLFADLLRSRLEQMAPEEVPELHRRASAWYEGQQLAHEALGHALAAGDLERAADLVECFAEPMLSRSEEASLLRWLEALPKDLICTRPWLCVYTAQARYAVGLRDQAEFWLQHAEQALEDAPLPSGSARDPAEGEKRQIYGYIAAHRVFDALQKEDLAGVVEYGQQAIEFLPERHHMHSAALVGLGAAHWGRGDVESAEQAFTRGREVGLRCGNRSYTVAATGYVAIQQRKQGRLHQAAETCRDALQLAMEPGGRTIPAGGFPAVRLGELLMEWNDLEEAERYTVQGVELCARWGQADAMVDAYSVLARLRLVQGDLLGALESVGNAEQVAQASAVDPWVACWLDDSRVRAWLATGDMEAATAWAQTSGLRLDGELRYQRDLEHINLARVLVAQGLHDPSAPYLDDAAGLLSRLLEAAEAAGWVHETIKILILQALALQAGGEDGAGLAALARALDLAEPRGYVRTFLDEGAPMAALLRSAALRGIAPDYVANLLFALEQEREDEPAPGERQTTETRRPSSIAHRLSSSLVDPLSERELEVLRLLTTSLTVAEIAGELVIAASTARSHIKSIYGKLDVHSRMAAVERARELDLL